MNRPKILVFIDWYSPGYKAGGPVTSMRNFVHYLNKVLDIYIVTSDRDYLSDEAYQDIEPNVWHKKSTHSIVYLSADHQKKEHFKRLIEEREYHKFYINGVYSKLFSIMPLAVLKARKKDAVIASRGMFAPSALEVKSFKKKVFLRMAKLTAIYKDVTFHATNEEEKHQIIAATSNTNVIVANNLPTAVVGRDLRSTQKEIGALNLVFLGRVAREKNTLVAIESLLNLRGKVKLDIIGEIYDEAYWAKCQLMIESLPNGISVNHLGTIKPSLVQKTLQAYHFMFLPSNGENFGHSIIESIFSGVPVVTSNKTPWAEIEDAGAGFVLNNMVENYSMKLQELLDMEHDEYVELVRNAQQYAQDFVKKSMDIEAYKQLFDVN